MRGAMVRRELDRSTPRVSKVDREQLVPARMKAFAGACRPVVAALKRALGDAELTDTRKTW